MSGLNLINEAISRKTNWKADELIATFKTITTAIEWVNPTETGDEIGRIVSVLKQIIRSFLNLLHGLNDTHIDVGRQMFAFFKTLMDIDFGLVYIISEHFYELHHRFFHEHIIPSAPWKNCQIVFATEICQYFKSYDAEKLQPNCIELCIRHGQFLLSLSNDSNIISIVSTLDSIFQSKSIPSLQKLTQESFAEFVAKLLLKQLVFPDDKMLLSFISRTYSQLYQKLEKKRNDLKTHFSDLLNQEIESGHDDKDNQQQNLISLTRILLLLEQVFVDPILKEQMFNEDSRLFKVLKEQYVDRESDFISIKDDWVVFVEVFNRITK